MTFAGSTPEYVQARPSFISGKCTVTIWMGDDRTGKSSGKSDSVVYPGAYVPLHDPATSYCHVELTKAEFEKRYRYCFLSGIRVRNAHKEHFAEFGEGVVGEKNIYWFDWGDPEHVYPTFHCIVR
jgi:hypothetical protein